MLGKHLTPNIYKKKSVNHWLIDLIKITNKYLLRIYCQADVKEEKGPWQKKQENSQYVMVSEAFEYTWTTWFKTNVTTTIDNDKVVWEAAILIRFESVYIIVLCFLYMNHDIYHLTLITSNLFELVYLLIFLYLSWFRELITAVDDLFENFETFHDMDANHIYIIGENRVKFVRVDIQQPTKGKQKECQKRLWYFEEFSAKEAKRGTPPFHFPNISLYKVRFFLFINILFVREIMQTNLC